MAAAIRRNLNTKLMCKKWLDLIRDNLDEMIVNNLKQGNAKPPMPFSDDNLLNSLLHTLWFCQVLPVVMPWQIY